jgi:hypothetical protein
MRFRCNREGVELFYLFSRNNQLSGIGRRETVIGSRQSEVGETRDGRWDTGEAGVSAGWLASVLAFWRSGRLLLVQIQLSSTTTKPDVQTFAHCPNPLPQIQQHC